MPTPRCSSGGALVSVLSTHTPIPWGEVPLKSIPPSITKFFCLRTFNNFPFPHKPIHTTQPTPNLSKYISGHVFNKHPPSTFWGSDSPTVRSLRMQTCEISPCPEEPPVWVRDLWWPWKHISWIFERTCYSEDGWQAQPGLPWMPRSCFAQAESSQSLQSACSYPWWGFSNE